MEKPANVCLQVWFTQLMRFKRKAVATLLVALAMLHQKAVAQQGNHREDSALVKTNPSGAFVEPEETSPYPYGGMQSFYRFIGKRITFDNTTEKQRAIVTFVVERDGSLAHIRIIKSSMSKDMDAQIVRALYLSPAWMPGTQNRQPVRVQYTFPITNY